MRFGRTVTSSIGPTAYDDPALNEELGGIDAAVGDEPHRDSGPNCSPCGAETFTVSPPSRIRRELSECWLCFSFGGDRAMRAGCGVGSSPKLARPYRRSAAYRPPMSSKMPLLPNFHVSLKESSCLDKCSDYSSPCTSGELFTRRSSRSVPCPQ